ncbi:hypothetical protein LF63_0114550 [Oleiagrimonas soli]|uniref:Uncharacterized protein n=2 Tax=Oleiagrimonas soli TaxID=1543381 RepID=A0A099CT06_9GAMM|nr:hypothetical protein LF63_0114550 [Oleiagrimonas soli]
MRKPEGPQMDAWRQTVAALARAGVSTEAVDRMVSSVARAATVDEAEAVLARLSSEADLLDWPLDRDYAAWALQRASVGAAAAVRRVMLQTALARARWYAACATAGAEGLARSRHVHELEALLRTGR